MTNRVVIIGAGLSGLLAASQLRGDDVSVRLVEKGRSVGGRLATRRIGASSLDHGAQFFTVRSNDFQASVNQWLADDIVSVWCEGFGEIDGYPRYRVNGGMNNLAKYLAADFEVITSVRAQAIIPGPDAWAVTYEGGARQPDDCDAVIVTSPVPQSLELLSSGGVPLTGDSIGLKAVSYHQVIALLVTLKSGASANLPFPGAIQQPDDPTFSFIADNQAKGISQESAITFHTAHELSSELWAESDDAVRERLLPAAAAAVGTDQFEEMQVKRWRYAGPVTPWPERFQQVASQPGPLLFAGDAFAGPKVEGAFLSGSAAGAAVRSALDAGEC